MKRYKRFMADIVLEDGAEITAHCPNPGAMLGVAPPDAPVWVNHVDDPKRKLKYSWQLVEADGALIGVNTQNPNPIAAEAIAAGAIPELSGYDVIRQEVRYGEENSRIDILLQADSRPDCYVEVKNVHLMREAGLAEFPDSVTTRGAKHLRELEKIVNKGERAVMLYIVQRGDCTAFAPAADIDPAYAEALKKARDAGVETLCYDCDVTVEGIVLRNRLTVKD